MSAVKLVAVGRRRPSVLSWLPDVLTKATEYKRFAVSFTNKLSVDIQL